MLAWFKSRSDPTGKVKRAIGDRKLPAFSNIVLKVLSLLRDPDSSLDAVAEQVALDPGISVRILGLANSSAFALQHEVGSVHHAISLLGRSTVESAVLGLGAGDALSGLSFGSQGGMGFWTTSAERALIAREVARVTQPALAQECFTAALLQDMAVPLLCSAQGESYEKVLERWLVEGGNLAAMEEEAFGWNHAHLGGFLSETWKLPQPISEAIFSHHDSTGPAPLAVRVVANLGGGSREAINGELKKELAAAGLDETFVHELLESAPGQARDMARLFS